MKEILYLPYKISLLHHTHIRPVNIYEAKQKKRLFRSKKVVDLMPLTLFIMNEGQLCKHTSDQANIT